MLEEQIIPRLLAQERHAGGDPPEALPLLRPRRIARRHAAHGRRGAGARRQRQARLPRALPAARDQADRARRRHGRHPRASSRRSSARCASGSATSSSPRTTRRWKAWCWRSWRAARARWRSSRRSPAGRSPRASRHLPGAEKVFRRGIVARDLGEICAARRPRRRAAGGRAHARDGRGGGAGGAARRPAPRHALAVLIDLDDGAGPDRLRRHDLPGDRDRGRRRVAAQPHPRRPRVGAPGRRRDGARLPAPPSPGLPVDERIDFEKT